jgi:hypothetical protein
MRMRELVPAEVRRQLTQAPQAAVFAEAELAGLPGAVRRHFQAAIAPGTPWRPRRGCGCAAT